MVSQQGPGFRVETVPDLDKAAAIASQLVTLGIAFAFEVVPQVGLSFRVSQLPTEVLGVRVESDRVLRELCLMAFNNPPEKEGVRALLCWQFKIT